MLMRHCVSRSCIIFSQKFNFYLCGLKLLSATVIAKACGVKWLGYLLRKEDGDVVRNALEIMWRDEEREDIRKERGESE